MELLMAIVIGILFMCATYLMLSKSILRIIIGTGLLSHGAHLLILTMGGLKGGSVPLLSDEAASYVDPLPQALILTAIVISFESHHFCWYSLIGPTGNSVRMTWKK